MKRSVLEAVAAIMAAGLLMKSSNNQDQVDQWEMKNNANKNHHLDNKTQARTLAKVNNYWNQHLNHWLISLILKNLS